MKEVAVLEHEDSTALGHNINLFRHVVIVKCGGATLELVCSIVEIQVKGEVRAFCPVGRFVTAIVVGYKVSITRLV